MPETVRSGFRRLALLENVPFNYLADKMKSVLSFDGDFTSAQFALEMIEGVEKVRFVKKQ